MTRVILVTALTAVYALLLTTAAEARSSWGTVETYAPLAAMFVMGIITVAGLLLLALVKRYDSRPRNREDVA